MRWTIMRSPAPLDCGSDRSTVAVLMGSEPRHWSRAGKLYLHLMTDLNPHAKQMADESMIRTLDAQARAIWPQESERIRRYGPERSGSST